MNPRWGRSCHLVLVTLVTALAVTEASATAPPCRFLVLNATAGNAVYDTVTRLAWQQMPSTAPESQAEAAAYCQALSCGGFSSGWRLPTVKEMFSMLSIDSTNQPLDPTYFPNAPTAPYWTATPFAGSTGGQGVFVFNTQYTIGSTTYLAEIDISRASRSGVATRCVR